MSKANNRGFTLIELIVVMAIFIVVMLMIARSFETIVGKSAQQVKSATTDTEGLVGLELLRSDLERAGFGLPWSFASTPSDAFSEANDTMVDGVDSASFSSDAAVAPITTTTFNEITPRAIDVGYVTSTQKILDGTGTTNPGTAYLVIKATNVANNDTGRKWAYLTYQSSGALNTSYINPSVDTGDNFNSQDRVITLVSTFATNGQPSKQLAMDTTIANPQSNPSSYSYTLSGTPAVGTQVQPASDYFKPADGTQLYLVYGVDPANTLRMPYNRADYYVKKGDRMPTSCNPGTGILYKGIVQQEDGSTVPYPLLTCVGDMQVEFELDVNQDGNITYSPTLTKVVGGSVKPLNAEEIRAQLKNVRIYILSHEGSKDTSYSYSGNSIQVGDIDRSSSSGRSFTAAQMADFFGSDWRKYRWKVRTIVVHPKNLD